MVTLLIIFILLPVIGIAFLALVGLTASAFMLLVTYGAVTLLVTFLMFLIPGMTTQIALTTGIIVSLIVVPLFKAWLRSDREERRA